MSDTPKTDDPMVAALLRERAGYVQRGLDDRIAAVDEQLKARGYTPPGSKPDSETPPPDPAAEPPKARRTPPKRTAKG